MRLSKHSDYSLRVLMYLAIHQGKLCQISEISQNFRVTKNNMIKVVNSLAKIGFIETIRGQRGGILLKSDPSTLTVGEIVRMTENNLELIDCEGIHCPIVKGCVLKGALDEAMKAFLSVLDHVTLADIAQNRNFLIKALAGNN